MARVRPAITTDARRIAEISVSGWRAAYPGMVPESVLDRLSVERREAFLLGLIEAHQPADTADRVWVVETDLGEPLGFATTGPCRDEDLGPGAGEIMAIYLEPSVRGHGLGRPLFERAAADLRERGHEPLVVWVLTANHPARRFYERCGWVADGAVRPIDFDGTPVEEVRYRTPARA